MNTIDSNYAIKIFTVQFVIKGYHLYKSLWFFWILLLQLDADVISSSLATNIQNTANSFTVSGGDIKGTNVVFSFSDFNIQKDQSVLFEDADYIHSIARVTGDSSSLIDGKLTSLAENFYFINPNGVIFGQNVQLDLAGSFYVSTADYLELKDGKRIYANSENLDFTSSDPEAFGFLQNSKFAPVTILDSTSTQNATGLLGIMNGDFNIIAGDIVFEKGTISTYQKIAILDMSSNKLLYADGNKYWGYDESYNQYYIDISDNKYYTYDKTTNSYLYDHGVLQDVDYEVQDAYAQLHTEADPLTDELISSQTVRESETYEAYSIFIPIVDENGDAIPLLEMLPNTIAPSIYMHDGDLALSTIKSEGAVNFLMHTSTADTMGDIDLSYTYINGMGDILLQAQHINFDASNIVVFSVDSLVPKNISLQAKDTISFTNGSSIISNISQGSASASTINLVSGELITFSGSNPLTQEGSFLYSNSNLDESSSANIFLNSKDIKLQDGTKITSTGYDNADSGSVVITASGYLEISGMDNLKTVSSIVNGVDLGKNGDIKLSANTMLLDKANILSSVYQDGKKDAGGIYIDVADTLSVTGDGDERISSNPNERTSSFALSSIFAVNYSSAKGPNLIIEANTINMDQFTLSQTSGPNLFTPYESGAVGDLSIDANSINLSNGSMFNSNNGYTVSGKLSIAAKDISFKNINLYAQSYNDKAEAGTYSIGSENTQNIDFRDSIISTQSTEANGGGITLIASDVISLSNSRLITEVKGGVGGGGNIDVIDSNMASFNSSELNANAYGGAGGNLLIQANNILKSYDSIFTASSALGVDGNIDFSGNMIEENLIVDQVNYGLLDFSDWSNVRCDAKNKSTFLIELSDMYEQKCADLTYINLLSGKK